MLEQLVDRLQRLVTTGLLPVSEQFVVMEGNPLGDESSARLGSEPAIGSPSRSIDAASLA